jgi:hypothetical protein
MVLSSRGYRVERDVWFLGDPDAVEQDGELPRYCYDGLALGLFASTSRQMETPLSEC